MGDQSASRPPEAADLSLRADAAEGNDTWVFDPMRWELQPPNGCAVQLSPTQAQLIRCLFTCGAELVSRTDLLTALHRPYRDASSRNLDVTVSRLRKKVEQRCRCKLPLTSVHGRGYAFHAPARVLNY